MNRIFLINRLLNGASAALLICTVATQARAQTVAPAASTESAPTRALEEVVVTAQKRSERINDVGMSVQAVSGDKLQELGLADPADLQQLFPGFSATRSRYGTPVYTIRGVGYQNSGLGAAPTVSAYLDEVSFPYSAMTPGLMLDLQRVEVLKGPQGTLFGNNSTGGAINFIAAKPTDHFVAGGDLSYGRFDTVDINGFISGPIAEGLSFRIAADSLTNGAWQKSYTRSDTLGHQDMFSLRASLQWKPSDRLTSLLTFSGFRDQSETQAAQFIAARARGTAPLPAGFLGYPSAPDNARAADWNACVPRLGRDNPIDQGIGYGCGDYKKDNWLAAGSLRVDYDVTDDVALTSISAYQHYDRYQPEDQDGTSFQNYSDVPFGSIKAFSQELRLAGSFAGSGHWVVGGNYQHDDVDDRFLQTFNESSSNPVFGFLPLEELIPIGEQKVSTAAVFANADYPITESISLEGGVRYTDQSRDYQGCGMDSGNGNWAGVAQGVRNFIATGDPSSGPVANLGPGSCGSISAAPDFRAELFKSSLDQDNVAWRGGLKWTPSQGTLLYGNVSQGFKSGSFPTLGASENAQLAPVVQERLLAYEAGFKQSLLARTLQVNGAVYYYDYKDKQLDGYILSNIFGPLTAIRNVPKAHVQGFELSAEWHPIQGLTIAPTVSMADTQIDKFADYNTFGVRTDFKGEAFPLSPKWQGTLDATYTWPINGDTSAFVGANVSYQSKTPGTLGDPEQFRIDAYTLLDLRLGVEHGAWRFQIWGRNVTDEYYWKSVYYSNDEIAKYAGMPATYGISVSWRSGE